MKSLFFVILCSSLATAAPPRPLVRLPTEKLVALAPMLVGGDLGLVESHGDGTMKQVTLLAFVRAPAEAVREMLSHPGRFVDILPNLTKSTEGRQPDGSIRNAWELQLTVSTFSGVNRFVIEPDGAVLQQAIEDGSEATYRYEVLPVEGGSVVVQYGYTDVKNSNRMVKSFLKRQRVMEHGLSLSAQLMAVWAFKVAAEKKANAPSQIKAQPLKLSALDALLQRGQVVYMQSNSDGTLRDVTIFDRIFAPSQKLRELISKPGEYQRFVPGVDASSERARDAMQVTYNMEIAVPMVSWISTYLQRSVGSNFEGMGAEGDLRGARYRWDIHDKGERESLLSYRMFLPLGQSSLIVRKLFKFQPCLEHGLNVALGLVFMRALRGQAEGWK